MISEKDFVYGHKALSLCSCEDRRYATLEKDVTQNAYFMDPQRFADLVNGYTTGV